MRVLIALLFLCVIALPTPTDISAQMQEPEIGVTAPAFTLPDSYGNDLSLSDYSGQWVVLEWINYGCPFVQKHYGSGNMQKLQADWGPSPQRSHRRHAHHPTLRLLRQIQVTFR